MQVICKQSTNVTVDKSLI